MALRRRWPTRAFAVAVAIGLVLVACTDDDDDEAGTTTTEESTTTSESTTTTEATTTTLSPEDAAAAAYQRSWDVTFQALNPPTELPEIRELFTGEALGETLAIINGQLREGHRGEGSMTTHPQVTSATASEVVLDDCAVENSVEYDANGQVVDSEEGTIYHYRVTVVNENGGWKVSDFERLEEPCTPQ